MYVVYEKLPTYYCSHKEGVKGKREGVTTLIKSVAASAPLRALQANFPGVTSRAGHEPRRQLLNVIGQPAVEAEQEKGNRARRGSKREEVGHVRPREQA